MKAIKSDVEEKLKDFKKINEGVYKNKKKHKAKTIELKDLFGWTKKGE